MAVDAATVRAAVETAGDAVGITHRPCALAGWGGRALDAAEAINVLDGPAAEGAWTVGGRRFDVRPVDAMLPWSGRAVAALAANLGDDGRALLLLEGAALETPPEEAWLERCEGSTVSPPSRVALASARGFRGQTEELLAFYDAAFHATAAAPAEDLRVVLACTSNGAVARIPCLLKAPDAGLVAAWVSSSVEEDGAGAWRAAAVEARAVWHRAPTIVVRDRRLEVETTDAWRPNDHGDLWTAALEAGVDVPIQMEPAVLNLTPADHLKRVPRDRPLGVRRLLKGRSPALAEVAIGASAEHAFMRLQDGPLRLVDGLCPPPVLGALAAQKGVAVCDDFGTGGTVLALAYDNDDETPPAAIILIKREGDVLEATSPPLVNPLRRENEEGAVAVLRLFDIEEPSPEERCWLDAAGCEAGEPAASAVPPLIVDACSAGLDAQQAKALRAGLLGKALALPNGAGRTLIAARCAAAHASLERSVLAVAPSARACASLQAALADLGASSLILPEAEALDADGVARVAQAVAAARLRDGSIDAVAVETAIIPATREARIAGRVASYEVARRQFKATLERAAATKKATASDAARALRAFAARGERPAGPNLAEAFSQLDGWPTLVRDAALVVIATPLALARWLPRARVFDVLVMDDAHAFEAHHIHQVLGRFVEGAALVKASMCTGATPYRGVTALPTPQPIHDNDEKRGPWRPSKVGTTLAAVADAVARARGDARLSDAAYDVAANGDSVVGAAFRALRGARCHVALAATVLELLRRYAAHSSTPKSAVVCAYDLQHARLLQVLMTLERHEDARFFPQGVDVRSSTDGLEALGAPDVVLSCCASKRDWRADAPRAALLVGRILDVDGASYRMDEPEVPPSDQEEDWVAALAAAASSVEDAPMRDLRTLCFRFDGRAIKAIANFDSIVVCHASEEIFGDDALSIALPAALRRRGWVRVYHLCETSTVERLVEPLLEDLCSWRHALRFASVKVEADRICCTIETTEPVPSKVLRALTCDASIQVEPWRTGANAVVSLKRTSMAFVGKCRCEHRAVAVTLRDATGKVLITETRDAPVAPPATPVARLVNEEGKVALVIRARGRRAAPWRAPSVDIVASIDEGEPVVKTLSKGCAASVRLALGRVAGPINVRVVARNSVGTSAVLELAADVPPPVEDDAFDDAAPALSDEDALAFDDDGDDDAAPPAPYERFSLTFVKGPLGIKLETSERPRVEAVTNDSEHHASLRRGDEVVGIGSTSFFESDDDVAKGGDGVFSTDDCYELLADAVEREAFPLTLHFRRRREADADVFVDAAPCDDALPAAAEEDDYFGFGGDDDAGDDDAAETVVVPHLRRVDERSCVVVGRPAAARLRAVDSGAPSADWVVFDAAEGQMLDGESLPWPSNATVVDVRLRDAEDAWSGPFALRRAGTASVLRIEDCWFVDEDEDPLRRIQRGGALCLRLKAQGEGHVRVVGEYKDLTLRADAHVASDDPHISLRPRPDDRRRWYAAVLDDGGDDAPLAFSVQVEVDGGASQIFAARVARKEDVLRPQPEHELVAGALPAFLARVAACCTIADVCAASDEHGAELEEAERAAVAAASLVTWTRRPLGAAAAASLLKAAGARDEACAYASSVRDAPPSTPCALFRGSSEEAPALEPLVGAATREEHNREPFFDVLATLRKEQAPHLAAALLRGAGARLAPSSNDEVPWFAASTKVEDHDRALWCFEGSEKTLYVPTIIEKGITKLDPRGYAFFAPGIERRAAQPWSRLEGHVGVVGKASLVAYDALPPAWEALLRHGVRRIHGPYARVFGGASGEATDATERVAICSSCDATQRRAVRRCVAGGAFVLRGPPGTGKSATLANSCLALAATGRSVLVVGQEVAAARVVAAKVGEILGGSRGVAGPDALMSRRKLQVDSLQVRIQRAADEAALPPATFAAEWLDRGFRVSPVNDVDDAYATCLFRPRPKAAPDRRFVCELCGRDTASAAPMAKHLRTHAEPKRRRKGDDAISERRRVVDAWRADEARIDVAHVARAAAVARQAQAADALHDADRALREALKRLEPADAAGERLAALALRCALDDVEVDGGEAFAHECAADDAAARALLAVLDAVADRRLGAAAASSALERCAGPPGARAVARSVLAARGAERRRRAARAAFAARRADASSVPDAPDVRALSDARRAASLALARAAVDAHFLEFNEPLITCATPELVASLNLVDDARYGAVLIDEASQFPTTPLALDLCAAASLTFVAAGDDLQLPPRRHATGLLDDVVDAGRVDLVPLEWHYRSGCPTLIGASNALFYGSRLVAPACAPREPGLVVIEVDAPMASARGPPAGLVNEGQARRIADDVVALVKEADAAGAPLSVGVVTLNRPQRGLIYRLLLESGAGLEAHPTCKGSLRRAPISGRDVSRDPPLFVESIDRIQGEERGTIFLSTLLAPRAGEATVDLETLDHLEEEEDSDDEQVSRRTPRRRRAPSARHYSTLSHAHGHRLLNVGITRAVETMRCYIHKECPAPGPHDARPGRRAFGWLCRTLLKRPSPCGCASCKALVARLAPTLGTGGDSDDDDDDVSFAAGARAWLRRATPPGGRVAAASGAHRGAVDAALVCGAARSAALLRGASSLDALDTLPRALGAPKLGWGRVARLAPADVLRWLGAGAPEEALRRVAAGAAAFADEAWATPSAGASSPVAPADDGTWLAGALAAAGAAPTAAPTAERTEELTAEPTSARSPLAPVNVAPTPAEKKAASAATPADSTPSGAIPSSSCDPAALTPPGAAASTPHAAAVASAPRAAVASTPSATAAASTPHVAPAPVAAAPPAPLSCRALPRRRAVVVVEQKDVATSDDEAGSLDSFVCEDHDSDSDASDPGVSDDDDDAPPAPVPPPPPRRRAAPIVDAPLSDEDDAAPPVASEPQYAKAEAGEVASEDESAGSLDEFLADSASEGEEAAADDSTASEADEAPAAAPPKARRRVIEGDY